MQLYITAHECSVHIIYCILCRRCCTERVRYKEEYSYYIKLYWYCTGKNLVGSESTDSLRDTATSIPDCKETVLKLQLPASKPKPVNFEFVDTLSLVNRASCILIWTVTIR